MRAVQPIDVVVAVAATATSVVLFLLGDEDGSRRSAPIAVALLVAAGGALLLRRARPVHGLVLCLLAVMAYLALGFPGGAELPSVLCAVYAAASSGHRWAAVVLTAGFVGAGVFHRTWVEGEALVTVVVASSPALLLVLLGDAVHARAALRAETRERMRLAAVEKEAEARARVAVERLRLAHELHDIMAHTITTMTVQAGAAMDLLEHDPERARLPLEGMRSAAKDAMVELRSLLEVLRLPDGEVDRAPVKGLAQLPELVDAIRSAGLDVEVVAEGTGSPLLPSAVDRTCFRVVQEACTNVLRHAGASRIRIDLRYGHVEVEVEVVDDGVGAAASAGGGVGLAGLRERVTAIGGRLEAGPAPGGGFRVAATLPRSARTGAP